MSTSEATATPTPDLGFLGEKSRYGLALLNTGRQLGEGIKLYEQIEAGVLEEVPASFLGVMVSGTNDRVLLDGEIRLVNPAAVVSDAVKSLVGCYTGYDCSTLLPNTPRARFLIPQKRVVEMPKLPSR